MWIWSCHFITGWLFCPLVGVISSLHHWSLRFGSFLQWLVLVFPFCVNASFRSSYRAALVVIKSLSNYVSIKDYLSPSPMKLSLARYKILGWKFFSLRMLNIGPHSLLACRVSAVRATVSQMGFPLWVTHPFSLAALSISSFISTQVNLMIMCLGVALLKEYLWCSLYFLNLNVGLPY